MKVVVIILSLLCLGLLVAFLYALYIARENGDAAIQVRREVKEHQKIADARADIINSDIREIVRLKEELRIKQRIIDGIAEAEHRKAKGRGDEMRGYGSGEAGG